MADEIGQAKDGVDEAWEDAGEKPRDGATIIRVRAGRLDIELFPSILVEYAGMYRLDAAKACSQGAGILVDNIETESAEALAQALRAHGEECFVVPTASIVPLPRAKPIHGARLTQSGMGPVDATGNSENAPWHSAIVLAMGRVNVESTRTKSSASGPLTQRLPYVGVGGAAGLALGRALSGPPGRETVTESASHTFLDIVFRDPLRRYRVDATQFDYSILGDQLQTNSAGNIRVLGRWLLYAADHMRTNFDTVQLMATGEVDLPALSAHGFKDLVHWLINLALCDRRGMSKG